MTFHTNSTNSLDDSFVDDAALSPTKIDYIRFQKDWGYVELSGALFRHNCLLQLYVGYLGYLDFENENIIRILYSQGNRC